MVAFLLGTTLWLVAIYLAHVPLTVILFALGWIPVGVSNVMLQTFRQTAVPEDLIGRVTSASYSMSSAATPVGFLAGGAVGDVFGSKLTLMYAGFGFLAIVLMFAVVPGLRGLKPLNAIEPTDVRLD